MPGRDPPRAMRLREAALAVSVVGVVTVATLGLATENLRWYAGLLKPQFAPPIWLGAATAVAIAGGLAAGLYRVLCRPDYLPDRPDALRLFALSMGLDLAWAWAFFASRHPSLALAAAAALAVTALSTTWRFSVVDRRAGLMLIPWGLVTLVVFAIDLSVVLRNG